MVQEDVKCTEPITTRDTLEVLGIYVSATGSGSELFWCIPISAAYSQNLCMASGEDWQEAVQEYCHKLVISTCFLERIHKSKAVQGHCHTLPVHMLKRVDCGFQHIYYNTIDIESWSNIEEHQKSPKRVEVLQTKLIRMW